MPIYEYQCTACGHALEELQKMSDEALTVCPTCHKEALEKLVSASSFQLKGTGWYATDFRNKGAGDATQSTSTTSTANTTSTTSTTRSEQTSASTTTTDSTST